MPLTVISRCLSAICVLITFLWSRDLFTLVGTRGLLDPNLAAGFTEIFPLSLYNWIAFDSPRIDAAILVLVNSVAISGALLFWKPRSALASAGLYLTFVCFKQTVALLAYGVYEFVQLGLFYIMITNLAAFAFRKSDEESQKAERMVGCFFRTHISMTYVFAGACKAIGPHWWNGESMWRALSRSDSTGQRWFNFEWLGQYPIVLQTLGISVLLLELAYPLAFIRRLRPYVVVGIALMHLGTIVAQGLTLFGLTMIALNIYFWFESKEWDSRPRLKASLNSENL